MDGLNIKFYSSFNFSLQVNYNNSSTSSENERNNNSKIIFNLIKYESEIFFSQEFNKNYEINISNEYFDFLDENIEDPNKTELYSEKLNSICICI